MNLLKSWISAHPYLVIGAILVTGLGPFLNKAVHTDDPLFIRAAEQIQQHPLNFFGTRVNWWYSAIPLWEANWNPPLMSYYLAGAAAVCGWSEMALHLAGLIVAVAAAAGIYYLARMWCQRPLLAALIAVFTPAFLVSSTTLMCDVLMLGLWIWAIGLWEKALKTAQSRWLFIGAGALAGLALLTKYTAMTLLPLLPVLALLRTRKGGWWVAGFIVPLLMAAGYEWLTAKMYGRGLLSAAIGYTQHNRGFPGDWEARGIIGLAFAGGSLFPLLCFAPWAWCPRVVFAGGGLLFGGMLVALRLGGNPGQFVPSGNPELMGHWDMLLQTAFFAAGGLYVLLIVATELWQRRDPVSLMLALWIGGGLFSAVVLNFTINARGFLPVVPAAAILLVRRLETAGRGSTERGWLPWPLIPAAAIALGLVVADYRLANSARTAAEQIASRHKPEGHQLWFEGHWGFQYYMEKLGGRPLDVGQSVLQPGDIIVVPSINDSLVTLPAGSVGWVEHPIYRPGSWLNLMGRNTHGAAGFFGAGFGPLPFVPGETAPRDYYVLKVFARVQFNVHPGNPPETPAGATPGFAGFYASVDEKATLRENPEATRQTEIARRLEAAGKTREAIQYYREALKSDPQSPLALNNLAWILATADRPELHNGQEAVQLAGKAFALTDGTQPLIITTLAAAYADTRRLSEAIMLIQVAYDLAKVTGQTELVEMDLKLLNAFATGHAVILQPNP